MYDHNNDPIEFDANQVIEAFHLMEAKMEESILSDTTVDYLTANEGNK